MARFYFKIQDQEGVLLPDRAFEFESVADATEQAKTLLAEMALDGLPKEPVDSISVELQDKDFRPLLTLRLLMETLPHGQSTLPSHSP
ncbi:hypothetical protein Q9314_20275 (plasmid) [Shinella sumterensis]|nr:hypothetical protein Q9314_20275 [Shinella sumterensis]